MMNVIKSLKKLLNALRFIGLLPTLRTIQYARLRDQINLRHRTDVAAEAVVAPGNQGICNWDPERSLANIRFGHLTLEIAFLNNRIIRVTWQPGKRIPPYAIAKTEWEKTTVHFSEEQDGHIFRTTELIVRAGRDGSLIFQDTLGNLLRHDSAPRFQGEKWQHHSSLQKDEHIYGLGERASTLNLRGRSYRMWNIDPGGSYQPGKDPLYLTIPVYMGLHSNGSYLIFYENSCDGTFDFRDQARIEFSGGALRYYFFSGNPEIILKDFTELTGRPELPPRWALGFHQSRWGYASQEQVEKVVDTFEKHNLPLSAIHLDIDYMRGYRVFSVDESRFPDLSGLAKSLSERGIRLVTILDPGVKIDPSYPPYRQGMDQGVFCTLPDNTPAKALVWPGWCVFPDFTSPKTREWWASLYPRLIDLGISGIWHDMNEPAAFAAWGDPTLPKVTVHDLEGQKGDHNQAHNLYGLLMNRSGHEALKKTRPNVRPWILSRSGWAGLQRYSWHWTADVESSWEMLKQTVGTLLGLSLSGIYFSGSDIGGFSDHPSTERFIRWFQLASMTPFFRTHSATGLQPREPWVFGEPALSIIRRQLEFRQKLIPYLYTLSWIAHKSGLPLMRPLFWNEVANPDYWEIDDAYLLGENLLVAPILEEAVTKRTLLLPSGTWFDLITDEIYNGPSPVVVEAPIDKIPVLVKGGSILPLQEEKELVLHLYPPTITAEAVQKGKLESWLYSDEGDGYGESRADRFLVTWEGSLVRLEHFVEGDYALPNKLFTLFIHANNIMEISVDGVNVSIQEQRVVLDNRFSRLEFKLPP